MMAKRIFILFLVLSVCVSPCFSQKRKTIDRSKPQTEKKETAHSSSSNSNSNKNNNIKKSKKTKKSNQRGRSYFSISSHSAIFSSEGGYKTFTVSSSGSWKIGVNTASWGHLTRNGNTLTLRVDANKGTSLRTDYFDIVSGSKRIRIDISQSANGYLNVSSEMLSFPASGGFQTLTINTNGSWKIGTSTYSWGHLSSSGNQLTVRVDANTNTSSRSDYFTIKSGNLEKRINISQSGTTALTSSKSATINTVTVDNGANVSGKKGLNVHVSFSISGMKGTDARVSCYFYDSSGNALIDTNGSYGTNGNPSHVAVSESIKPGYDNTSYSDLQIKIPYDELHLSGTYSRTLRVDVIIWDYATSNHREMTRKENTIFTCIPDISYLKIDNASSGKTKYFGESGGREYINVSTSASSYETWGVPSWCRIENKTSTGFTLVCNRNTSRSSRSDYMKVKAAGQEIRIDIKQDACSGPSATITSIEQEHNVYNGYYKGMNIKLKFDVSGMLNRTIKATAWFYYGDNITKLNDGYGGQVNISNSATAQYENTTFTMTLFIPYRSLNMAPGFNGPLSFDIVISDSSGNKLARKDNNSFTYTQP